MVNDMSEKADVVFAELTFLCVQSETSCFDVMTTERTSCDMC